MALHPPPTTRQASYTYSLAGGSPFKPSRGRQTSAYTTLGADEDYFGQGVGSSFEERLEMEEQLDGMDEERGLEETLEKLGFGECSRLTSTGDRGRGLMLTSGAYQWRLLVRQSSV